LRYTGHIRGKSGPPPPQFNDDDVPSLMQRSRKNASGNTAKMDFHLVISGVLTAGAQNFPLVPANYGTRCADAGDEWGYFRCLKYKFRLASTTAALAIAGVAMGVPITVPSGLAQVSELLSSVAHLGDTSELNWSRWISVPKTICQGNIPWYKTVAGSEAVQIEAPLTLCCSGTGTNAYYVEVFFTLEFRDPVDASNTPVALELRNKMREERVRQEVGSQRQRLLKLLAAPTPL